MSFPLQSAITGRYSDHCLGINLPCCQFIKICVFQFQVHDGASLPYLQCIVNNRRLLRVRQRNFILDGKFPTVRNTEMYYLDLLQFEGVQLSYII